MEFLLEVSSTSAVDIIKDNDVMVEVLFRTVRKNIKKKFHWTTAYKLLNFSFDRSVTNHMWRRFYILHNPMQNFQNIELLYYTVKYLHSEYTLKGKVYYNILDVFCMTIYYIKYLFETFIIFINK